MWRQRLEHLLPATLPVCSGPHGPMSTPLTKQQCHQGTTARLCGSPRRGPNQMRQDRHIAGLVCRLPPICWGLCAFQADHSMAAIRLDHWRPVNFQFTANYGVSARPHHRLGPVACLFTQCCHAHHHLRHRRQCGLGHAERVCLIRTVVSTIAYCQYGNDTGYGSIPPSLIWAAAPRLFRCGSTFRGIGQ